MIVLIGFMGAGKTTVGARIGARLGLDVVDSDAVVEARLGCTIAECFARDGEGAFRAAEQEAIAEVLRGPEVVLALGGGAVGTPGVRAALAGHDVVYLDASLERVRARVGDDPARPLLRTRDVGQLYAQRQEVYARAATVRVDADADPDAVASAVLRALDAGAPRSAGAGAVPGGHSPACVLVGPPGAGTTTVGKLVAQTLDQPWCDVDDVLAAAAGRSPAEVLVEDGEEVYRRLERSAAREALARPGVVVLGGGAVMDDEIARSVGRLPVVFLDVGIADAAKRVGFDNHPGLIVLNPRRAWSTQMQQRRPRYAQVATWRVDTAGRSAGDVAAHVATLVRRAETGQDRAETPVTEQTGQEPRRP